VTVHVDEVHTDVVSAGAPAAAPAPGSRPEPLGAAEERWRDTRSRLEWLASRVRAEGFDD
jgi:hypothetical protein